VLVIFLSEILVGVVVETAVSQTIEMTGKLADRVNPEKSMEQIAGFL